jgi:type I restriction enzyme M protein
MFNPKQNLHALKATELKNYFVSLFDQIAMKHGYYNAFDHFLDCTINGFCPNYSVQMMDHIRSVYAEDERFRFGEMIKIWILTMNQKVTDDHSFHDFFGNFYEEQSITKQKGFAQYFTPEPICQLLASIIYGSSERETLLEPACGSGRLNLAFHSINHKCFHHANDLDITCAKMTALNFVMHGVKGMVTCDDGLWPTKSFRGAFLVNYTSAPFIEYLPDSKTAYFLLNSILPTKQEIQIKESVKPLGIEPLGKVKFSSMSEMGTQLNLF